jgi:hypothetical protein
MGAGTDLRLQLQFIATGDAARWMNDVEMTGLSPCHWGFGVERALYEQWAFVFALREPRATRARIEAQCEPCLPAARERSGTYGLTR